MWGLVLFSVKILLKVLSETPPSTFPKLVILKPKSSLMVSVFEYFEFWSSKPVLCISNSTLKSLKSLFTLTNWNTEASPNWTSKSVSTLKDWDSPSSSTLT